MTRLLFLYILSINILAATGCPGPEPGDAPPPDKPKEETPAPQDAGSEVSNPQVDAGNAVPNPGVDAGSEITNPVVDAGSEVTNPAVDAGNEVTNPSVDAGSDVTNSGVDAGPTVVADTTPPETNLHTYPSALTDDTSFDFGFDANESPVTFLCSVDGATPTACTSPHTVHSLNGPHTFSVAAVDAAGNEDPTPAIANWTVDTTPPVTTIESGPDSITTETDATFVFSANENPVTFYCELNGVSQSSCSSPQVFSDLEPGDYVFEVYAVDSLGHVESLPQEWSFQIVFCDDSLPTCTEAVSCTDLDPDQYFRGTAMCDEFCGRLDTSTCVTNMFTTEDTLILQEELSLRYDNRELLAVDLDQDGDVDVLR